MARSVGIALSGALLGAVVGSLLVEHPPTVLLAATGLLGAVLFAALWRVVGF